MISAGQAVVCGGPSNVSDTSDVFDTCRNEAAPGVIGHDVYSTCMARTNLYIDDELLDLVMRRYDLRTKTAAVDKALRHLAGQPMTTKEALAMRGASVIGDVPRDQPPT